MVELINLTNLSLKDKQMVLKWRNHKRVRQWMFSHQPISTDEHLNYIDSLYHCQDKLYFLVKQQGLAIGVIDFTHINYQTNTTEFGLYANPALKRMGDLLLQTLINYAFDDLKIHILRSTVFIQNHTAIKLYQRFDFIQRSIEVIHHQQVICMELTHENRFI